MPWHHIMTPTKNHLQPDNALAKQLYKVAQLIFVKNKRHTIQVALLAKLKFVHGLSSRDVPPVKERKAQICDAGPNGLLSFRRG